MAKVITVFVKNYHLSPAGIQFLVGLTTLLMVIRFTLDAQRHRSNSGAMRAALLMLDTATYSLLHYSLGVMQRPSMANSYYQVWAVLLVTLRNSVKHGRPAGVAFRQTPLVDLMFSFWAANILRSRAVLLLKIPVWLLWSINSARIIHGFISSEHATASHKDNVRLVAEYMRREHQPSVASDPATMKGYRYLVLGEDKQKKEAQPPGYRLELKMTHKEKLITLDKIWEWEHCQASRVSKLLKYDNGKLKDLCLSFALYKLLRRRFYNLPIYESKLDKTKQLIFEGILGGTNARSTNTHHPESEEAAESADSGSRENAVRDHHKRVFRITEAELSFLNEFFYSRHALIFANGFPFLRLFLSSLLVGAIAYMAVAVHQFSKIAKLDELGRVRHGVFFTWILLSLLGVKEIIEMRGYIFSDWTKVLLVCSYARQPWWLRGPVMEWIVRQLCKYTPVKRWHGRIGQYNLVFGVNRQYKFALTDLPEQVRKEVLSSLERLCNRSQKSFPGSTLPEDDKLVLREMFDAKVKDFEGDVHRILLWHIATCYCELHLAKTRGIAVMRPWWVKLPWWVRVLVLGPFSPFINRNTGIWTGPFVKQSELGKIEGGEDYITAVRLSQYCAHVLRLDPPLIPGNDILTKAVFDQVIDETHDKLRGRYSIDRTFAKLQEMIQCKNSEKSAPGSRKDEVASNQGMTECQSDEGSQEIKEDEAATNSEEPPENRQDEADQNEGMTERQKENNKDEAAENTLLKMGSQLGQELIDATDGDDQARWAFLAQLWADLVVHLAQSTGASQHKIHLSKGGELLTHLWALLSHAGLTGKVAHGEMGSAATPTGEHERAALEVNA